MNFKRQDAFLTVTKALPNGAGSVTTDGIYLGNSPSGDFLANCELEITAPALTTAQLPDTNTMTYTIEHDTDSAFGTVATLQSGVLVQTGAGGAGAAAATARFRLPLGVKPNIRVKVTKTGTGNASTVSTTVKLLT